MGECTVYSGVNSVSLTALQTFTIANIFSAKIIVIDTYSFE